MDKASPADGTDQMTKIENDWTLYNLASEFFFAAKELEKSFNPDRVEKASYYLCAHSLELAIKCFLFLNGVSLEMLKSRKIIGHDLEKALNKAKEYGFDKLFDDYPKYECAVIALNKFYCTKELEYMKIGDHRSLPKLEEVKEIVENTFGVLFRVLTAHLPN